jgi:rhodanese-related sulfurtransferase
MKTFISSTRKFQKFYSSFITKKEIQNMIQNKSKYCLIDVRTIPEFQEKNIETSKNVPLQEFPEAFKLSENDFKMKYGFKKPSNEELVILYCRSGARSSNATKIAEEIGYTK